ncbi:MAG: ABC transporter permease, antibiotic transport system permease protein [Chloroflexi bacterium CSP1-4]|nr:MAG: ABC transporter permease, antibiotic transport system permease protein [Chloroflexi bacterium CSP1-4]
MIIAIEAGAPLRAAPLPAIPLRHRVYGFGSIYGKTIRDSRLAFIIAAGLLGGMALVMGVAVSSVFPTPEARKAVNDLVGSIPASMVDLFGKVPPAKLGTLGGYMTFKYGAIFALGTALWSILALSGTLAGEASRGSLDFVAAAPFGKRRIALEKLAAHLTMLGLAMAILAAFTTISSTLFGDAALGDQVPLLSSVGFALWAGFLAVFFGGLALALAPVLGRAGSTGVAGLAMVVLWVMNGLNLGGPLAVLSPFRWTADHIALIGQYDWAPLALVGVAGAVFLAIGVELFGRRDLGVTAGLSLPGVPAAVLGVRGPVGRAFGDQLPRALSWGIGLGLMGALVASLVGTMSALGNDPTLVKTFAGIFPGFDLKSAGGWLQLYAQLLFIAAGFGAATFVSKWASDETDGRLEMVLTTPTARAAWAIAGGVAAILAIAVMTVLFALGIGLGAASGGVAAGEPMVGSIALGLYAAAIAGVGVAVGGLWRTSLAAEITALVVVATYLIDLVAPPLKLPDWVHQLALTAHFGQPMLGIWDPVGIVACLVIAVGGIALGAWGIARRDIGR